MVAKSWKSSDRKNGVSKPSRTASRHGGLCFFERSCVPHYKKTVFPKFLQSLMMSYFQNGCLVKKKHIISLKGHIFFRHSYYYQLIEMYTQRFQRHNKNEFLCLFVDILALMMSLPKWGAILTKRWKGTPLRECVLFAPSGMKIRRQV